ncbi:MAG: phage recombination protein Bet, partial [Candidatus Nanopelagicales bacterium]|nr:phage recombination protein Bet [Candidatus Nanopelagicales bacterium]
MSNALAIRPDQTDWTDPQKAMLVAAGVKPANHAQALVFLNYCTKTGLDPFTKQIYLANGAIIVGIDGLRLLAARTGEFRGTTTPLWCDDNGEWHDVWVANTPPVAAKVGVMRAGFDQPVFGVVMWTEFGGKGGTWGKMPAHMLSKVAESHALRKAFPAEMSGLYTSDEMAQADRPAPAPRVDTSHLMDAMPLGANGEQV